MASQHHTHIKNLPAWHAARAECIDRDGYTCTECGATDDLTADHTMPLDLLFADGVTPEAIAMACDVDLLVTLCRSCNGRKGARVDTKLERATWVHPDYLDALGFLLQPAEAEPADDIGLVF